MVGRKSFRKTERVLAEVPCKITYNNKELNCKTIDVSEGGLAVRFEFPEYIPYDEVIKIKLFTDRYLAEFSGKVVHIAKGEKEWKYAFEITDIDKDNFKQLLYITYDRVPTLPNNLDENTSIFDDIRVNILTRNKKLFLFKRKLPRVDLDKTIASKECGDVKIKSFNYEYMALEGISESILKDQITLKIKGSRELVGILEKVQDKNIYLYKIKNYKEIADDKEIKNILNDWIREYNESLSESSVIRREESFDEFNEMQFL
jgi:cellulose synthase (UDP-forming)